MKKLTGKLTAKRIGAFRPLLLAVVISGLATSVQASGPGAPGSVGEVSLVVGKAWILHPGAERERIRKGTHISVFDSIETSNGGHVHVRFIDGALISVRPASTLEILRYDYDAANPAQSAVKLNLVEGVFRGISGEAAKNARENFRLNTPIAAIGVRGTDFVVSADRDTVRALVTEGAIVLTRFSNDCLVEAFGPCSQDGLELVGGAGQIIQLSANTRDPVLLPLGTAGLPESADGVSTASVDAPSERKEDDSAVYTDTVTTRAVNQTIADSRNAAVPPPPPPPPPPLAPPPPPPPPAPEFTPDVALTTAALTDSKQLVWGRYVGAENERISTAYSSTDPLFAGLSVTVGNGRSHNLYRVENGSKSVQPGLGIVGFTLDMAQAKYTAGGVTSLMEVNGGSLSIDFDRNRFATSLNLSHAATGALELVDSGLVFAGGYFHHYTTTQWVAGAVSLDGEEAGYFFEKTLENGFIEGLTLWGRQP